MKQIKVLSSILILFSLSSTCFAQEHVGGGKVQESNLRYLIGKLDIYLESDEGKDTFPEIGRYDLLHPEESFHTLIQRIRPVVTKGEVTDGFDDDRDCVSHFEYSNNRHFDCNQNALPEYKLENMASLYRITLHELFLQVGIETPISKAVPSDYSVSWRITNNVHLETYQEWVPGKKLKTACTDFGASGTLDTAETSLRIVLNKSANGSVFMKEWRTEKIRLQCMNRLIHLESDMPGLLSGKLEPCGGPLSQYETVKKLYIQMQKKLKD